MKYNVNIKSMEKNKTFKEIKEKIAEKKNFLLETYGVEEIGVFGSFARGDNEIDSDIDIAVEINHEKVPVGLFEFSNMRFYLENLLGQKVDLVIKRGIKPLIRDKILKQMVII